ncbi:hypothetical protein [Aphanizomenon flos-aquae]|uniref:Uncharacterized protein n=1 Tax=Aphanizomenon flos-aquae FACHB-1040 TaxID=2692887 RepID=A0ABR8BU83_APHFL|nr:hypothetical protein [Aphanizomenon flos-aquae]MBD2278247.1 hypothetical protein [Aphanizomenon flos-aquae FACHB-1040]
MKPETQLTRFMENQIYGEGQENTFVDNSTADEDLRIEELKRVTNSSISRLNSV